MAKTNEVKDLSVTVAGSKFLARPFSLRTAIEIDKAEDVEGQVAAIVPFLNEKCLADTYKPITEDEFIDSFESVEAYNKWIADFNDKSRGN